MRSIKFLVLLLLPLPLISNAQQADKEIQKGVEIFFDALSLRDTAMVRKTVTPDFLLIEDGEVWNIDTLTSRMSQFKPKSFSRVNSFKFIRTETKGDISWVTYRNTAHITLNGNNIKIEWLESAVLVKTGDVWVVKMLHSTELAAKKENQ